MHVQKWRLDVAAVAKRMLQNDPADTKGKAYIHWKETDGQSRTDVQAVSSGKSSQLEADLLGFGLGPALHNERVSPNLASLTATVTVIIIVLGTEH